MNSNLRSRGEKIFGVFNAILMTLLALMCLLPLIHVLAVSLSDSASASANKVKFWPMGLNTAAYDMVFSNAVFLNSFGISVLRTVAGTAINLLMVILAAYPLSKDETELKGRNVIIWFFTIPMLISGGMIPSFLLVKNLGMMDSLWALILPGCVPTFYVIMMMNFIRGISKSISEAAAIDGAGRFRQMLSVTLPALVPIIAVQLIMRMGHIMGEGHQKTILLYNEMTWEVSDIVSSYVYRRGLKNNDYSFGAAVDLFNSLVNVIILCSANYFSKHVVKESLW